MARFVYGMNQSLDGYVDHESFGPDSVLFAHFIEQTKRLTGSLYGRKLYGLMHYWDVPQPSWTPAEHEFALAWQRTPKWVVSTTLASVGPNATLLSGDVEAAVLKLKAEHVGEIEVGGTVLARTLNRLGLIDEYRIYLHPVVLGSGTPFFNDIQPKLKLTDSEKIGERTLRLSYVPDTSG